MAMKVHNILSQSGGSQDGKNLEDTRWKESKNQPAYRHLLV
jgi:hypothetical protein